MVTLVWVAPALTAVVTGTVAKPLASTMINSHLVRRRPTPIPCSPVISGPPRIGATTFPRSSRPSANPPRWIVRRSHMAREGFIHVPGGDVYYRSVGTGGVPLLCLHGGP